MRLLLNMTIRRGGIPCELLLDAYRPSRCRTRCLCAAACFSRNGCPGSGGDIREPLHTGYRSDVPARHPASLPAVPDRHFNYDRMSGAVMSDSASGGWLNERPDRSDLVLWLAINAAHGNEFLFRALTDLLGHGFSEPGAGGGGSPLPFACSPTAGSVLAVSAPKDGPSMSTLAVAAIMSLAILPECGAGQGVRAGAHGRGGDGRERWRSAGDRRQRRPPHHAPSRLEKDAAVATARTLLGQGKSIDLGLTQINSANLAHDGLTVETGLSMPAPRCAPGRHIWPRISRRHGVQRTLATTPATFSAALPTATRCVVSKCDPHGDDGDPGALLPRRNRLSPAAQPIQSPGADKPGSRVCPNRKEMTPCRG